MGKNRTIVCDTNILIGIFRNNRKIIQQAEKIGEENIGLTSVNVAELYYGALSKNRLKLIKNSLKKHPIYHIDIASSKIFIRLMLSYVVSHRIKIPDALVASVCIANSLELYTMNVKDFDFIEDLKLYKPK